MITHAEFIDLLTKAIACVKLTAVQFDERTLTVLDQNGEERFQVEVRELDCR